MPSHNKNNLHPRLVRKRSWPKKFKNPEDPERTEQMQHLRTRTRVCGETTGSLCSPCLQPAVLMQGPTGSARARDLADCCVAPIKSSFLSAGTSVTFTPRLSLKRLLNQFLGECEPVSLACSALWDGSGACPHYIPGLSTSRTRMTRDEICEAPSTVSAREEVQGKCCLPSL